VVNRSLPVDAIELDQLTKRYGARRGIEAISLAVPEGGLFGFIGPNGAGKTTTIRILLGLLEPTAGTARVLGRDVAADGPAARAAVGYVAGETHLYPEMRVADLLAYLGRFHPGDHAARRRELIDLLEIDHAARAADLSLGNKKKVAIAAALQHRPRLVVLDEPTGGLDPVMRARLFDVLRAEVERGATVFFSSHDLAEVQAVCRRVAVLSDGKVVAVDEVARLRGREVRRVRATFDDGDGAADRKLDALAALAGVAGVARDDDGASFLYDGPMPALLAALAEAAPRDVRIEEPSLEEIFLRYYARPDDRGGDHVR
jgi:beta-exotoxin I transport system ATP-binding protein